MDLSTPMILPGSLLRCQLCREVAKMYCLCAEEPLALCCECIPKHNEEPTDHQLCSLLCYCLIKSSTTSSERSYKSAVLTMLEKEIKDRQQKLRQCESDWNLLIETLLDTLVEKRDTVLEELRQLSNELESQITQVVEDLANNHYDSPAINTLTEITFSTDTTQLEFAIEDHLCRITFSPSTCITPSLRFLQECYLPAPVCVKNEEMVKRGCEGGKTICEKVKKVKGGLKAKTNLDSIAVDEGDTLVIQSRCS